MEKNNYVVIGGSSGIGRAVVRMLTERRHNVYVGSRSAKSAELAEGVTPFTWDATQGDLDGELLPDHVQGLVYCPGTIKLMPFSRLTADQLVEDFRVNLVGAARAVKGCLPAMKQSPRGAAIVLFSTVAVQTGMPFHASVASAKGAVEGLTRALAAELAPRIRVNAIAPSLTDTPLAKQLLSTDTKRKASEQRHPLKRIGAPEDIARMAVFLLGDDAAWTSGQVLHVDGGVSSLRLFS